MKKDDRRPPHRWRISILSGIALILIASACAEPATTGAASSSGESVTELQAKVAQVSSELDKKTTDDKHSSSGEHDQESDDKGMKMADDSKDQGMSMGMGMHGKGMKMKGMSMDSKDKGMKMADDSKDQGMSMGMGMHGKGMMQMMGMMHGEMAMMKMGDTEIPPSALPGFPGISHIYHVGATGFFLDHTRHLHFTEAQKAKLEGIKERSLKQQAELQQKVEHAEKDVWALTSSDQPDVQQIVEKVKVSEALKTEKRLGFIRSVGEAATVLTPEQRKLLVSPVEKDETSSKADSAAHSH